MTTPHEILRAARQAAGYDTAESFAVQNGFAAVTYRSYENGSRAITMRAAKLIAPKLGIEWLSLVDGTVAPTEAGDPIRDEPAMVDGEIDKYIETETKEQRLTLAIYQALRAEHYTAALLMSQSLTQLLQKR